MEEMHVLLRNRGKIIPTDAKSYMSVGGYVALKKALSMEGAEIIQVLKDAGLRGRGGAGFPTYLKLQFAYNTQSDEKYIVCNADEGEPGTNKDRVLLSEDPNSIFEGMAIAAKAIGAHKGFIYLRSEYPYIRPIFWAAAMTLILNCIPVQALMFAVRKLPCLNPLRVIAVNQDSVLHILAQKVCSANLLH